jgi:hypothetical protein
VLDGDQAIAAARAEILALQTPPEDFAPATDAWPVLRAPS